MFGVMIVKKGKLTKLEHVLQTPDHRAHSSVTWMAEIISDNCLVKVAVKDLDRSRMIPEFVGASVAELIGLASPKPFLVEVSSQHIDAGQFQNGIAGRDNGETRIFFGSEFLALPIFDRGLPETQYGRLVAMAQSPSFAQIIVLDALIGNVDRAERNILVSGKNLVPFDYDQALFGLHWTPQSLAAKTKAPNHSNFDTYLPWSDVPARKNMLQLAKAWSKTVAPKVDGLIAALPSELALREDEHTAILGFLQWRAENLLDLIQQRLEANPIQV